MRFSRTPVTALMINTTPISFACLGILLLATSAFTGRLLEGMNLSLIDTGAPTLFTAFEIGFYQAVLAFAGTTVFLFSIVWLAVGPAFPLRMRIQTDFRHFLANEKSYPERGRFVWTWSALTLVLLIALIATLRSTHQYPRHGVWWFEWLVLENGLWETLTAACLMVAGVLIILSVLKYGPGRAWLKLPTLALGLLLVIAGGEEVSWGQHWFGFATPDILGRLNQQGEFNLHNLDSHFTNHLATLFFLVYLVLLPLASFLFPQQRYANDRLAIPIAPLAFVPFAVVGMSMVDHTVFKQLWGNPPGGFIGEARETLFGIVMLGVAIRFLLQRQTFFVRLAAVETQKENSDPS